MTSTPTPPDDTSRSQRLKAATGPTHDLLDKRIMAEHIFATREQFARFLIVQYRFHRDVDALYARDDLASLIPDLGGRRRLQKIASDLSDLGQALPEDAPARLDRDTPLPVALGWLYVAEGSNLGGAVLFKFAREKLGLDETCGASHLAPHADGAARHWRQFTAVLDAVALDAIQEHDAIQGAQTAFATVQRYVEEVFA